MLAVLAWSVAGSSPAAARPKPGTKRAASNLFASTAAILQVNHQYCPVLNVGIICADPSANGVIEGGFWPKGTPDSYIFASGLQIAGNIPANAGFAWAGDTVGAFFMDPRGDQTDGTPVTLVYNSLDATDRDAWPAPDGVVADTSVYNSVLLGRSSVSQQDLWFRAWDGNPNKLGGRTHPMGVLVDVRGMAWNYPSGNEDAMYFVYTFTNVTDSVSADYNNVTIPNHNATYLSELGNLGAQFQQLNSTKYGITMPAQGYAIQNMFAAYFEDCDVGTDNVSSNYSTPVFPFSMGVCYEAPFFEASWVTNGSYDPTIFNGAFAAAPGFTAAKYLKSPKDSLGKEIGIAMFSNTVNGATGYPDPVGIKQMYRYISGTSDPALGDLPCTDQANHKALHYCVLWQTKVDTRFFQSSGPLTLLPAHAATIVVAIINAPPVNNAAFKQNVGGDFKPGYAATGDSIFKDPSAVRPIETVMGWEGQSDKNADQSIEQNEVQTVPRSLLNKALVTQAVFDAKFLLPFAPEAPNFFVIPGDNQVTVVWQPSRTEDPIKGGDPYFAIASDPTSALYDPDFRHFDVEGYRIYRGRTPGALALVAQFDYAGTVMTDVTGQFNWGNCAPELGVNGQNSSTNPATCPQTFDSVPTPASVGTDVPLVGTVVQIPPGGRVKLSDGTILVTRADTMVTGGASGFPPLADNGVPFAFVDRSVRNLFQYFYSVTAFDANSLVSGPSSLESPRVTKAATPRANGANAIAAGPTTSSFLGANGVVLGSSTAYPSLDATTGEFSGPMPPTGAFAITGLAVYADQLVLPNYTVKFLLDSAGAQYHTGIYYVTAIAGTDTQHVAYSSSSYGDIDGEVDNAFGALIPADSAKSVKQGLAGLPFAGKLNGNLAITPATWFSGMQKFDLIGQNFYFNESTIITDVGGSRWFDGANEATADPTLNDGHGKLTGVTKIFSPTPANGSAGQPAYASGAAIFRRFFQNNQYFNRAADVKFYWGATAGTVDSVVDVSDHVPVKFGAGFGMTYGFVPDLAGATAGTTGTPDGVVSYIDVLDGPCLPSPGGLTSGVSQAGCAGRHFAPAATLGPTNASGEPVASDGSGFGVYVDGEVYFFLTAALPVKPAVWTLRSYSGRLRKGSSGYSFSPRGSNPVPGLSLVAATTTPASYPTTGTFDLSQVHTVPDPYYVTNALEITPNNKVMKFVNLPSQAIVRIYSVSGILVQVLTHNDPQGGGELDWDLRNRSNQFVASGVYFYHVEAANGQTKVGRFTVVQFAP